MANIINITRRTSNKIDATAILSRNGIFRRTELSFVDRFKGDFEAKSRKGSKDFERNVRIKRQNNSIETRVRVSVSLTY